MKSPFCPRCSGSSVRLAGFFFRSSDRALVQRYFCKTCSRSFSKATTDPCFRQKTRQLNKLVYQLYCSGVSLRRLALILRVHRRTVTRKFLFLALMAEKATRIQNLSNATATKVEFDDLETFVHTKCKPVSASIVVETGTRRILGVDVAQMPATGRLAKVSVKKYGPRKDDRSKIRKKLLRFVKPLIHPEATIKSDMNPSYAGQVKKQFPRCRHEVFRGRKPRGQGLGELKKGGNDPIFSINHTCAMFRANQNRLFRKTWCTSKKIEHLRAHMQLYVAFHNLFLLKNPAK